MFFSLPNGVPIDVGEPLNEMKIREELSLDERAQFLQDMSLLGEAIQAVCGPKRVNYSIYGNSDNFLHAHVFPRYVWEPPERKPYTVWQYPKEMWVMPAVQYCAKSHIALRQQITEKLVHLMDIHYT